MLTLPWPLARADFDEALAAFRSGAVVVYPTETVFGIGVALSAGEAGIERVRAAKRSPPGRPYLLVASSTEMAFSLWSEVPPVAAVLGASEWPGPLTMIGPARDGLPPSLLGQLETPDGPVRTVSVRVPGDAALRQLVGRLGEPILSTSANLAGRPTPLTFEELELDALAPDLVLETPRCEGGLPSTILSTVEDPPRVLRQGAWRPPVLEGP